MAMRPGTKQQGRHGSAILSGKLREHLQGALVHLLLVGIRGTPQPREGLRQPWPIKGLAPHGRLHRFPGLTKGPALGPALLEVFPEAGHDLGPGFRRQGAKPPAKGRWPTVEAPAPGVAKHRAEDQEVQPQGKDQNYAGFAHG
jgi:hypothetical protein